LMDDCHRLNLFGGCKEAEKRLGIERRLKGIDGSMAVELWENYIKNNDENTLSTLLEYNKEDVLLLKVLRERLLEYTGEITKGQVPDNIADTLNEQRNQASLNNVSSNNKPLTGKVFVLTGRLESFSRHEAEARIKELGGAAKGDVTRKTDYVVVGADPGSKLARAREMGIKTIDEKEFIELLESSV
jgi:NAD-dependent DNA ligase